MKRILVISALILSNVVQSYGNGKPGKFNDSSNGEKDTVSLFKSYNFERAKWKLMGNAYGGKYVSFKLKENGVEASVADHFMIGDTKILNLFKRDFKGVKTTNDGTTGELILTLMKDDKVVWQGVVFLFKKYCKVRTANEEYLISYKVLKSLKYSKPVTSNEYNKIVFKK